MSDQTKVFSQRLWSGKAPLAKGDDPADVPSMVVYQPANADGSAIVVCPGGAYGMLAAHEAEPIARWLNTFGVTAAVLTYRLGPKYHHPAPLLDVSRAIRTMRANASQWKVDPKRVGVIGFSAGGHLCATVSTKFDSDGRDANDPVDRESARPDVAVLAYPVITLEGVSANVGSRKNLLGENPSKELVDSVCCDRHVTPHTSPAFIFHTVADAGVPVENAIYYATALRKAGVGFEMHLFEPGPHGVGLAANDKVLSEWPKLCENWLKGKGFGR